MRVCIAIVRQELGDNESQISDKIIEDSLWYYYYDTEKTVQWLQSTRLDPEIEDPPPGLTVF